MQLFLHQSLRVAILKLYNSILNKEDIWSSIDTLQISNFTTYSQNSPTMRNMMIREYNIEHSNMTFFSHML